jgi:hypothetical protein
MLKYFPKSRAIFLVPPLFVMVERLSRQLTGEKPDQRATKKGPRLVAVTAADATPSAIR